MPSRSVPTCDIPEFTHVSDAENFLAKIALLVAKGHLDIQSGQELSGLVKTWIDTQYAKDELHLDKSAAREARPQAGDEHGEARRVVEEAEEEGSTAGYTDAELRRAIVQAQRRLREFPLAQVTRKLLVELRKEEVRRDKARRQAATCAGRGEPRYH